MECKVHLSGTDEDEDIDVEGDTNDIIKSGEIKITPKFQNHSFNENEAQCSVKRKFEEDSHIPFKRTCINRKHRATDSAEYMDLSAWWSSVSESKSLRMTKEEKTDQAEVSTKPDMEQMELNSILFDQRSAVIGVENETAKAEPIIMDDGEIFKPPEKEVKLSLDFASEGEVEYFPDFFNGQTKYTPDRYLMIRNAILEMWLRQKPAHVKKVSVRSNLQKKCCGNVNNIGRIHRYLESVGAINFNSTTVWWKVRGSSKKKQKEECLPVKNDKLEKLLQQRMSGRSRKQPAHLISELDMVESSGGYTIDHANNNAIILPISTVKRKKQEEMTENKYKLINCKKYSLSEECPFDVTIEASALIVMDTHSHLSNHEVMGLLGGYVMFTDMKVKVHIVSTHPCKSASSSRHCEMDAVCQSQVCECIITRGQQVLGWYHSHPTFPPQPSSTDILTQLHQQRLFASHGSAFIGIILSPYNRHQLITEVKVIHISLKIDPATGIQIPYEIPYIINKDPLEGDIASTLRDFIKKSDLIGGISSRISQLLDPIVQGSNVKHLDKLMKSITSFITSQTTTMTCDVTMLENSKLAHADTVKGTVTSQVNEELLIVTSHSDEDNVSQSGEKIDKTPISYKSKSEFIDEKNSSISHVRDDVIGDIGSGVDDLKQLENMRSNNIPVCWKLVFDELRTILLEAYYSVPKES